METPATTPADKGWLETAKEKLDVEGTMSKFNLTKERVFEIALYLGIGFISGFLFKKYGKYLLIVVLTLVGLAILQQFGFVDFAIKWDRIQGLQQIPATTLDASIWTVYWDWIKTNIVVVISFVIGFLVGYKVG